MGILLFRVDDRLLHGQVVIGWGRPLSIDRVLLVDDGVAASPWEQDLYRMAAPDGLTVAFATTDEARQALSAWQAEPQRTILLTGDLETMVALREAAPEVVDPINLGGIHHQPGRVEKLRYLYLNTADVERLRQLQHSGATVTAQDLPTSPAVPAADLL
jgi:PTS system mannose-specific IIB component/fructoselysine and glucoselysine-specific PTS system IIB component